MEERLSRTGDQFNRSVNFSKFLFDSKCPNESLRCFPAVSVVCKFEILIYQSVDFSDPAVST